MEPESTVDNSFYEVTNSEGTFVDTPETLVPSISLEISVLANEMGLNLKQNESILERLIQLMGPNESPTFIWSTNVIRALFVRSKIITQRIFAKKG